MKACLRLASYVVSMAIHDDPPISEDVPALPVSRPSFRTRSWPASKKLWKSQLVCISDKFCRHWITFPAQTWSISIWTGIVVSRSGVPTASAGQPEGGWVTWQGGLRWPSILWFWGRVWNSDLQRSQEVTKRNCHLFFVSASLIQGIQAEPDDTLVALLMVLCWLEAEQQYFLRPTPISENENETHNARVTGGALNPYKAALFIEGKMPRKPQPFSIEESNTREFHRITMNYCILQTERTNVGPRKIMSLLRSVNLKMEN